MKLGYTLMFVENVPTTMNFYSTAFGLEKAFLHESGQYGEMKTGETKLGFVDHQTAASHGFPYIRSTDSTNPPGIEIGLITNEVGTAFERAIQAGAKVVSEPKLKPWGQMVAYVLDCNGFLVELCSPM